MKNIVTYFGLLTFIFFTNCGNKQTMPVSSPFNPTVKRAIDDFISFNEIKITGGWPVYRIMSYKRDGESLIFLRSSYFYDNEWVKFYTLYNGYLITYDESDTTCMTGLIRQWEMTKFQDPIPGFNEIHNSIIPKYDAYMRTFKIISPDSLEVISTSR